MKKDLSLTRLTSLYIVGNLASKIINFALFFLYTFYISMSDLGFFDLIITSVTLITPVITLQVYDAILRWLIDEHEEAKIKKVITSSLFILVFNLMIFTIFYVIVWDKLHIKYGLLIYMLVIVQTFYVLIPQIARGMGKNSIYAFNGVIFSLTFLVTAFIFLGVLQWKIQGLLIANIVAAFISLLYLVYKIKLLRFFSITFFDRKLGREMINYSMPLIPNTLSWWAIATSNRYIILYFLGTSLNGLFAVALKLPSILLLLSGVFSMAWIEKSMRIYNSSNRDDYYTNVFEKYFSLLFCAIAVLISITKPLLKIIVQSAYYEVWKFLPFLFLAVGFQSLSSFYGTGYLNARKTRAAFLTTIYGAIVTVISSLLLIPLAGLSGASIAILLGYLVMFLIRVKSTKKYFNITLPLQKMLTINLVIIVISVIAISDNFLLLSLNAVFSVSVFFGYNKKLITDFFLKNKRIKLFAAIGSVYFKGIDTLGKWKYKFRKSIV